MLPSKRVELVEKLNRKLMNIISDKKAQKEIVDKLEEKYGLSPEITATVVSLSSDLKTENDNILYCILSVLDEKSIPEYFTEVEIKNYSGINFRKSRPDTLTFKAIQINDDQWIGKITAKEIGELSDNAMIHYNEATQRPLTRIVNGEQEVYKFTKNTSMINRIIDALLKRTYISDTLTFCIPQEQTIPEYDEESCTLTINNVDYFNIIDGYHRYIAFMSALKIDKDYNCNIEIRFVSFSDEKARNFIYQQDQKTRMRRIASESFNTNSLVNKTVEMIKNKGGMISGIIGQRSIIDPAILSFELKPFFDNVKKKDELKKIIEVRDLFYNKLVEYMMERPEDFELKWSEEKIIAFVYSVYFEKAISEIDELEKKISADKRKTKTVFKQLKEGM